MASLLLHMVVYGFFGLGIEVFFTAVKAAIQERSLKLQGFSTLWAFPLYASAAIFFEPIHDFLIGYDTPWFVRGGIYIVGIYLIEFVYGFLLVTVLGRHPWKYSGRYILGGYINLLYAPAWFTFSFVLERLHDFLKILDGAI